MCFPHLNTSSSGRMDLPEKVLGTTNQAKISAPACPLAISNTVGDEEIWSAWHTCGSAEQFNLTSGSRPWAAFCKPPIFLATWFSSSPTSSKNGLPLCKTCAAFSAVSSRSGPAVLLDAALDKGAPVGLTNNGPCGFAVLAARARNPTPSLGWDRPCRRRAR